MKKFTISSDLLKPALKKLGQAINEKSVLPILKNILCKVGSGEVELIASDLEITIAYKCMAVTDTQDPFEILIPFAFLNKVVAVIKSAPVTIEHPSARKVKIVCDQDVFEISGLDKATDYIKLPVVDEMKTIQLNHEFSKMLHKVMLTAGKDETRPVMTRACLDILGYETYLVTTDAHYLCRYKIPIETEHEEKLLFSSKMAKAIEGLNEIELSWSAKNVCIRSENVTIWNNRFEDTYPNYLNIIPTYGSTLELNKSDLIASLNKACISNSSTKQTTILLNKEKGLIIFETEDVDFGTKINVKIPGEYTGATEVISINAKKMLVMMDQFEADKVNLHIHSPSKAMLVSTEEDDGYLGLLMPLIINS